MISGEAVEAGAREVDLPAFTGEGYSPGAALQSRESARDTSRAVLEAAYPHIRAQIVEEIVEALRLRSIEIESFGFRVGWRAATKFIRDSERRETGR